MKTLEFIEKVENLGYTVERYETARGLTIREPGDYIIARVGECGVNHIDTCYNKFMEMKEVDQSLLAELILEYASTPMEEREVVKLYRFRLQPEFAIMFEIQNEDNQGLFIYLNYLPLNDAYEFNSVTTEKSFHTVFSQKSIDNFPDHVKRLLPLCDRLDVTE